jgi:site-specific recombinase XerD
LVVLREQGVIAELPPLTDYVAAEMHCYDDYMRDASGLTARTRSGRRRTARRLLLHKFGTQPVVPTALRPADLRRFMAQQLGLLGTTSDAIRLVAGLRAYLRYRTTRGDRVHSLLGVMASPAQWSLATLPRALKAAEIEQLLASFTSTLRWPRRGYAMVRCALDMGLRSSEVAKLQLADIDWRTGTVSLHRTKSRRQDMLPLPAVTGRALADYVQHERPKTSNPAVFVRCLAPRDKPIGVDAVRRVIRDAYQRIGLTHGRTHALRHTLACRLLEHGSSLKEVADVLRHRSLSTTLIYAKLDHPRLAAVALPWPGSTP